MQHNQATVSLKLFALAVGASTAGLLAGAVANAVHAPWQLAATAGVTTMAVLATALFHRARKA